MLSRAVLLSAAKKPAALVLARGAATQADRPKRAEHGGKVRLGFLPEEWFTFFYNKTGVTGPYVFGAGLMTYLCSKEIYVMEHEYYNGLSLAVMVVFAVKKFDLRWPLTWTRKSTKSKTSGRKAGKTTFSS